MTKIFRQVACFVVLSLVAAGLMTGWSGASVARADSGANDDKVTICHSTAADTNGWVVITISVNAVAQHFAEHKGKERNDRVDFIVPFGTTSDECQSFGGGPG